MNESDIKRLIQAELDGRISAEEEAALQQALAGAQELREEYERDRALAELLRADRDSLEAPEGLAGRVASAAIVRGRAATRAGRVHAFHAAIRLTAAAAAVVVVAVGAFWMGTMQTSAQSDTPERLELRHRMDALEADYPDRGENIRALYQECFDELDRITADRDAAEREARGRLERAVEELLEGR